jgi:NADH-quinone oxidoreductase subunit F
MRLFGVSGHVKKPGVYELPLGIPLKKIIYDFAGGVPGDKKIKAVVPGGLSSAVLTPDQLEIGMDFDQLKTIGTMAGSAGVIVMDETVSMVEALLATMRFYAHESCGQCSPCREGTGWVYRILSRIVEGKGRLKDIDNLLDIGSFMTGTTICALADGAAMPLLSYLQKFRGEFEDYIRSGRKADAEQDSHGEYGSAAKRGQRLAVVTGELQF